MKSWKWLSVLCIAGICLAGASCSSDDDAVPLPAFTDLPPDEVEPFLEETVLPIVSQLFFLFEGGGPLAAGQDVAAGRAGEDLDDGAVSPQEGCQTEDCPEGGVYEICELGPTTVELIFEQCTADGETVNGTIVIRATSADSGAATFQLDLSTGAQLRGTIGVAINEANGCLSIGFEDFLATAQGETLVFAGLVTGCENGFPDGTLRITVVSGERGTFYVDLTFGADGSSAAVVYDANGQVLYTCDLDRGSGTATCSQAA